MPYALLQGSIKIHIMNLREKTKIFTDKALRRRTRWTGLMLIVVAVAILEIISLVQAH